MSYDDDADAAADVKWQDNVMYPTTRISFVTQSCWHQSVSISVQNGAVTQKDTLNDDEFEPYLNTQARQVSCYRPAFANRCCFTVESLFIIKSLNHS